MRIKLFVALFILLTLLLAACRDSAGERIAAGNSAFANEDYEAAADAYAEAEEIAPEEAEPVYNLANTRYRQGIYTETHQLLPWAAAIGSPDLAQRSQFNLGNAYYQVENWAAAIEAYKEALRIDPGDMDAKHNLELTQRHLAQQSQEQSQSEQQEPESDQQQNEQSDQNSSQESQQQDETQNQESTDDSQEQTSRGDAASPPTEPTDDQANDGAPDSGGEESEPTPQIAPAQPQEGLSEEQARQLLQAVGENAETLQERMQQIYVSPGDPPEKDW